MEVTVKRLGSAVVVILHGSLTVDVDTVQLHELVGALSRGGVGSVVLDLGQVQRLDGHGIGELVTLYKEVRPRGATLTLVNVERRQKRLLEMVGLLDVFPVFDSWKDALVSPGPPTASRTATPPSPAHKASWNAA